MELISPEAGPVAWQTNAPQSPFPSTHCFAGTASLSSARRGRPRFSEIRMLLFQESSAPTALGWSDQTEGETSISGYTLIPSAAARDCRPPLLGWHYRPGGRQFLGADELTVAFNRTRINREVQISPTPGWAALGRTQRCKGVLSSNQES